MRLAVIPARGGSKRIPRKNIKPFLGKPIIAYSIEAALKSACFDRVIVSTDDDEIAAVAEKYGAEVPFRRPAELSNDYCATTTVIQHAINWMESRGSVPRHVCCLYATAPFITAANLRTGYEALIASDVAYVFSATSFPFPIQRAIKLDSQGNVSMFQPEHYLTRSQDLEPAYHDAGQFYWGKADSFKNDLPVFTSGAKVVMLPRSMVQDIDTVEDWEQAELLYRLHHAE